jgi:hypothetical protein
VVPHAQCTRIAKVIEQSPQSRWCRAFLPAEIFEFGRFHVLCSGIVVGQCNNTMLSDRCHNEDELHAHRIRRRQAHLAVYGWRVRSHGPNLGCDASYARTAVVGLMSARQPPKGGR